MRVDSTRSNATGVGAGEPARRRRGHGRARASPPARDTLRCTRCARALPDDLPEPAAPRTSPAASSAASAAPGSPRVCPSCGTAERARPRGSAASAGPRSSGAAPAAAAAAAFAPPAASAASTARSPRRSRSAASSRSCSPTSSASRRSPRAATPRTSGSSCRATSSSRREIIDRYGGTVEKFIGDAVMAVWGAPTAHEDDAERAVRAGLELVDVVTALGPGDPGALRRPHRRGGGHPRRGRTRAWSRATSSTPPRASSPWRRPGTRPRRRGDPAGRRAARSPSSRPASRSSRARWRRSPSCRALRVVAERRRPRPRRAARGAVRRPRRGAAAAQGPVPRHGAREARPARLDHGPGRHRQEPPRVGVPEVRRRRRRAGLVARGPLAVVRRGDHVLGARRDGPLARRPARDRRRGDDPRAGSPRSSRRHVPDEAERRAHRARAARAPRASARRPRAARRELFSRVADVLRAARRRRASWRSCSRTSTGPTPGTLDFIDHMLEWSRNVPILIITLARPELLETRPDWGAGKRIVPRPRPPAARRDVDARPARRARARTCPRRRPLDRRARRGHPAVRGRDGPDARRRRAAAPARGRRLRARRASSASSPSRRRCTRSSPPASTRSMPADRALVQDAAVLGQSLHGRTRSPPSPGSTAAELEPRLAQLVRGDLIHVEIDPRSPERGQYAFVQALIREVAYSTLACATGVRRHLAAARFFESLGDDELAGRARRALPRRLPGVERGRRGRGAPGAGADRAPGGGHPRRAARVADAGRDLPATRRSSVAADDADRADMLEQAGRAAMRSSRADLAIELLTNAVRLRDAGADPGAVALAIALLGDATQPVGVAMRANRWSRRVWRDSATSATTHGTSGCSLSPASSWG